MKSLSVKLVVVLVIGLIFVTYAEVWGAEYEVTLGMDGNVLFVRNGWLKNQSGGKLMRPRS